MKRKKLTREQLKAMFAKLNSGQSSSSDIDTEENKMAKLRNWDKKIDDPYYIKYYNQEAEKILLIEKIERDSTGRVNFWQVSVGGSVSRVLVKSYIRTKKQAQRIALSWMKQHPSG